MFQPPGTFVRPFVGFKNCVDLFKQPETLPIICIPCCSSSVPSPVSS